MKLGKRWVAAIEPSKKPEDWIAAVSEIPAGSCCKYKLDKVSGQISLARALPRDVRFPINYGFVPHTRCRTDDEETDVLILTAEPLVPLTVVKVRVIGGFVETTSDEGSEERLLAVAVDDPNVSALDAIDADLERQIETFVRAYKQDEGVLTTFDGWLDREAALALLARAFKRGAKRTAK